MKKTTQILLFLLFSYCSLCAQVNVQSIKISIEETETIKLNNLFEEYEVIEVDCQNLRETLPH